MPVALVPAQPLTGFPDPSRIVVGIDGSPMTGDVIAFVAQLAEGMDVSATVVECIDIGAEFSPERLEEVTQRTGRKIRSDWCGPLGESNVDFSIDVQNDDPRVGITDAVERTERRYRDHRPPWSRSGAGNRWNDLPPGPSPGGPTGRGAANRLRSHSRISPLTQPGDGQSARQPTPGRQPNRHQLISPSDAGSLRRWFATPSRTAARRSVDIRSRQIQPRHPRSDRRSRRAVHGPQPWLALQFIERFVFSYLVGDGDLHARNLSVWRRPDGVWEPSPWYDIVCTAIYGDMTLAAPLTWRLQLIREILDGAD